MNKSESKYFNTAQRMDEVLIDLLAKKSLDFITVKEICEKAISCILRSGRRCFGGVSKRIE